MDRALAVQVVKFTVLAVFSVSCFWRAWENHLEHRPMRRALIVFGTMLAFMAWAVTFRILARMAIEPAYAQSWLDGWGYLTAEIGATASAGVLFFVLQKPAA